MLRSDALEFPNAAFLVCSDSGMCQALLQIRLAHLHRQLSVHGWKHIAMSASPGTAYIRSPPRLNGLNVDQLHDGEAAEQPLLRRPGHASGGTLKAYLLPFAFTLFAFMLAFTLISGWNSIRHTSVASHSSSAGHAITASAQAAAVAAAVAQLQSNQTQILGMLYNLTELQKAVSSSLVSQQHQKSDTGQLAAAADAGTLERPAAAAAQQAISATVASPVVAAAAAAAGAEDIPAAMAALPSLTKLHNAVLRQSKDFDRHRASVKQLIDQLVHLPATAALSEVQQQLSSKAHEPLKLFGYELYKLILNSGKLIPCREDSTLVVGETISLTNTSSSSTGSGSSSSSVPRYFFATNLRDNSVQMPQFTLSLLQTLLRIPRAAAFVSVYESNSDDGVQGWTDVLQLVLNVIGTHNRVVSRGMLVKTIGQYRIEFLAQVRNMALAPLYSYYAQTGRSSSSSSSGSSSSAGPGMLPWEPDYVVFINDVYFCWGMVLRLMNYRADITCGTDWWQNPDATTALPLALKTKSHKPKPQIPSELKLEAPLSAQDALSPDQTNPIVFYDVWVARDISGSKFWWTHPFILDPASSAAVERGLPVRASCCWNGLVLLKAEPFKKGIRFRSHLENGECRASECTLLCDDFARLGYQEIVVDAGVQVAYDWDLAREMMAVGIEGVGQSTWAEVKVAGISQADRQPAYQEMECCSLKPGAQWVSFFSDCFRRDMMKTNYTQQALDMNKLTWDR